jgi:hypothetical protein
MSGIDPAPDGLAAAAGAAWRVTNGNSRSLTALAPEKTATADAATISNNPITPTTPLRRFGIGLWSLVVVVVVVSSLR